MKKPQLPNINSLAKGIALAGNMSMTVGVITFLGILAGSYLDKKVGGKGILFAVILILSVVLGLYSAIRTLLKSLDQDMVKHPPDEQP